MSYYLNLVPFDSAPHLILPFNSDPIEFDPIEFKQAFEQIIAYFRRAFGVKFDEKIS
jgi:hypothetical protein